MAPSSTPTALTIAGSDPSGGAGIQADLKVFHHLGVYGMSVLTLLTVQNTEGVEEVEVLRPEFVARQLRAVLDDIPPKAAKTGALGSAGIIREISAAATEFDFPLIVDPIAISTHGAPLIDEDAIAVLREDLLPNAYLLTPNLAEAALLSGFKVETLDQMKDAAEKLHSIGAKNVLVKGGHLDDDAIDVLLSDQGIELLHGPRFATPNTHGTGCVLSAAIVAYLSLGDDLNEATRKAKSFVSRGIEENPGLGKGCGPIHLWPSKP